MIRQLAHVLLRQGGRAVGGRCPAIVCHVWVHSQRQQRRHRAQVLARACEVHRGPAVRILDVLVYSHTDGFLYHLRETTRGSVKEGHRSGGTHSPPRYVRNGHTQTCLCPHSPRPPTHSPNANSSNSSSKNKK